MTMLPGADKAAGTAPTAHSGLSIVQAARHSTDSTCAGGHSVQEPPKELQLVGPGKRRKIVNSLYWFSSQKHQEPPWHYENLMLR